MDELDGVTIRMDGAMGVCRSCNIWRWGRLGMDELDGVTIRMDGAMGPETFPSG